MAGPNLLEPRPGQSQYSGHIQTLVDRREFLEIGMGELEERCRGSGAAFLEMDERAGQLNQRLVEQAPRLAPFGQPEFFQNFVRLVKHLAVEAFEERQVMGVQISAAAVLDQRRDFGGFIAHQRQIIHARIKRASRYRADAKVDNTGRVGQSGRMSKPALGRGLGALLGGSPPAGRTAAPLPPAPALTTPVPAPDTREHVERVPLGRIRPCSLQPRKMFSPEALQELADSIKEQGIVQPLIVRERDGNYELIAGERRWRASQLLGLAEVPVIVRQADDRAVLELALIENLQRENLNAIEEAYGYAQLVEQFQLKQEEVAVKVGKSRAVVANALRLLKLPASIQEAIRDSLLSVGHAKVILGLTSEKQQKVAADRAMKEGLNVRQTEALVARLQARAAGKTTGVAAALVHDANVVELENKLRERFGTKVRLKYSQGKGSVEIAFFSDDDLDRILSIVGVKVD